MRKVIFGGLIFLLVGCKQTLLEDNFIYFESPQPNSVSPIAIFPESYRGCYSNLGNQSICITERVLLLKEREELTFTRQQLDSIPDLVVKNGQLYDKSLQRLYDTKIKNDSIYAQYETQDTLFAFRDKEIAKIYKSSLILNYENEEGFRVSFLKFSGKNLRFVQLGTAEDAKQILGELAISHTYIVDNADTIQVFLAPKRAEFRKLLRIDSFAFDTQYRKK